MNSSFRAEKHERFMVNMDCSRRTPLQRISQLVGKGGDGAVRGMEGGRVLKARRQYLPLRVTAVCLPGKAWGQRLHHHHEAKATGDPPAYPCPVSLGIRINLTASPLAPPKILSSKGSLPVLSGPEHREGAKQPPAPAAHHRKRSSRLLRPEEALRTTALFKHRNWAHFC